MTIYVDDYFVPYGRMLMSHMMGTDLDELHKFADRLGLRREWFQDKRIPHYDISKSVRQKAIELGAVAIPWGEIPKDVIRA